MTMTRANAETSWGAVPYRRGGDGPTVLLIHGLLVDGGLWDGVAERLIAAGHDVVVPDLPLGAHSYPTATGADVTPHGIAGLIDALAAALGLHDVTLVGNDTGGAICQLVAAERPDWLAGLVLTPCDAYENFLPPAFRPVQVLARRAPALVVALLQPARLAVVRRSPLGFGWLTKRGASDALSGRWMRAFYENRGTRRDVIRTLAAIDSADTIAAAERLKSFDRPALIAWADGDRFFPRRFAERLAADIPGAELVEVKDSYAFTPLDQPDVTTALISGLVARTQVARQAA